MRDEPGSAVICVLLMIGFLSSDRAVAVAVLLQRREQLVEPLVALVPEPPVPGEPVRRLTEGLALQVAETGGRAARPRDEPCPLQHLEMPGDRRLGHLERRR